MHCRRLFLTVIVSLCVSLPVHSQEEPTAGKQVEQTLSDGDSKLNFLCYLPQKYGQDAEETWPLVLFLHGRGESYGPLSLVAKWGPPKFAARGDDLPFILISPQCPGDGRWSDETRQAQLGKLLDKISDEFKVDSTRVYLTGLSMGGYGSWTMAANHPDRFAAVVPVCGGGDPTQAEVLKSIPIWVFHGDQDRAVPFQKSVDMVEAIRQAGGSNIRFTSLEHVGHNCWSSTYAMPELYQWMLRHNTSSE